MSNERAVESPLYRPAPGLMLAIVATLGWAAVTLLSLLLDWDYLAPGYRTIGDDISAAGAQIWGLPGGFERQTRCLLYTSPSPRD